MQDAEDSALRIFVPLALDRLMPDLIAPLGAHAGQLVVAIYDLNPIIPRRILAGAPFDLAITNPWYVPDLIARGLIAPDLHRPFGRAALAIAGRGEASPESSRDGVIALLRRAGSIAYTAMGTSGKTFLDALDRLGLGAELAPRLLPMGIGESAVGAVAAGQADLAIAPMTTAVAAPGLRVQGVFPSDLGTDIEMSVFLGAQPGDAAVARRALDYLTDPALDPLLVQHGLTRFAFAG